MNRRELFAALAGAGSLAAATRVESSDDIPKLGGRRHGCCRGRSGYWRA